MPYLLQISDPDEMRVTLQISGKYSPDVLDDAKRRLLDMYRGALATRYPTTHGDVPARRVPISCCRSSRKRNELRERVPSGLCRA